MKRNATLLLVVFVLAMIYGCGPRETVVNQLGNAENSVFTPDGRLFLTGANIWEVKQNEEGYEALPLMEEDNNSYLGIAYYKNYLFAVCTVMNPYGAWLLRAELTETPQFEKIFQLTGFTMANGMAIDKDGHVYIADETLINTKGRIMAMNLSDDDVPEVIPDTLRVWLSGEEGAQSPNGIVVHKDHLFFTNLDISKLTNMKASVRRVAINGEDHGEIVTLFERRAMRNSSIFDDLTSVVVGGDSYIIACDYMKGTVFGLEAFAGPQQAPLYETDDDTFAGPTSCIVGQGLGFKMTDLLVTEGGVVLIDARTNFGNRLSVIRYQPED